MINRVLIRIKVVQMLYCYLLSQNEFKIEPAPDESASRDKKYAYSLYLDLLMMVLELSGYNVRGTRGSALSGIAPDKHIYHNPMAKSLSGVEELKSMIRHGRRSLDYFNAIIPEIYAAIPELPAYKTYARKKDADIKDAVALWCSVLTNLVENNPGAVEAAREDLSFTNAGFERGVAMTIATLSSYGDNRNLYKEACNSLKASLDKAYELYHALLLLPVEITRYQDQRLDAARHKFLPSDADLNPNLRFVENKFVKAVAENPDMEAYLKDNPIGWDLDTTFIKSLFGLIENSDLYKAYMSAPGETTFEEDCEFWRSVMKNVILPSDDLAEILESKSVYWNDDLHIMSTFLLKTIRRFSSSKTDGADMHLLPQYKDEEDSNFGAQLFQLAVSRYGEYRELIDRFVNSRDWDSERLAFMDIVIMVAAIAELENFPAIPVPVTMNEYIEIANAYSTPKSGSFINGILFSVVNCLKEEGKILGK